MAMEPDPRSGSALGGGGGSSGVNGLGVFRHTIPIKATIAIKPPPSSLLQELRADNKVLVVNLGY